MNQNLPIEITTDFIKARNVLHQISQISWSYSILNKKHPIDELSEADAKKLIKAYQELIEETQHLVDKN